MKKKKWTENGFYFGFCCSSRTNGSCNSPTGTNPLRSVRRMFFFCCKATSDALRMHVTVVWSISGFLLRLSRPHEIYLFQWHASRAPLPYASYAGFRSKWWKKKKQVRGQQEFNDRRSAMSWMRQLMIAESWRWSIDAIFISIIQRLRVCVCWMHRSYQFNAPTERVQFSFNIY